MPDEYTCDIQSSSFKCVTCGYDLTGSALGGVCPECGTPVRQSLNVGPASGGVSSSATTCMILGIIGITACGLVGPFAIWLYYRVKGEVERGEASPASLGTAKVGLILGWISTGLTLIACPAYILLMFITEM